MQFLEECRKPEEEGEVGQAKAKVKAAAATLPPQRMMSCQDNSISTTSNRCLGGASEKPSVSGNSHTTLLKGGQDWAPPP